VQVEQTEATRKPGDFSQITLALYSKIMVEASGFVLIVL
jgi:hypothetical protein